MSDPPEQGRTPAAHLWQKQKKLTRAAGTAARPCAAVTKSDGTKFGKTESGAVWLDESRTSSAATHCSAHPGVPAQASGDNISQAVAVPVHMPQVQEVPALQVISVLLLSQSLPNGWQALSWKTQPASLAQASASP